MCNNNSGYWQERACNNSTGNSNGCFPTFSLKSYRFLNIIDLDCENYTLPSQKHDWGFYPVYLPDACLGMEMLNFLQKFAKHKHCISLSNSLFCSQITAHLFCLEKKPSDILPNCCSLTLHGIRAQKQVVEWASTAVSVEHFFQSQECNSWSCCHPSFCCAIAHPYKTELKFEVHFPRFGLELAL